MAAASTPPRAPLRRNWLLSLFVLIALALLFGFLGLMVAVPLLAVVIVPIKLLYVQGVVGDVEELETESDSPAIPNSS